MALKVDTTTGDLVRVNGSFAEIETGSDEHYKQRIDDALSTFAGEWFLDTSKGVPLEMLGIQQSQFGLAREIFRQIILTAMGGGAVTQVGIAFESEPRRLRITYNARTPEDVAITSEVIVGGSGG